MKTLILLGSVVVLVLAIAEFVEAILEK